MSEFRGTLSQEEAKNIRTPADLVRVISENEAPLFAGVKDEDRNKMEAVAVFNIKGQIGVITFKPRVDNSVDVHIVDVKNEWRVSLSKAATRIEQLNRK